MLSALLKTCVTEQEWLRCPSSLLVPVPEHSEFEINSACWPAKASDLIFFKINSGVEKSGRSRQSHKLEIVWFESHPRFQNTVV